MAVAGYLPVKDLVHDDDIRQHYTRHRTLGEGMFGETVEVTDVNDPTKCYAMKIQPKAGWFTDDKEAELLRLYREVLILNRILPKHPNIVELKDILIGPETVFIVLELCHGPTLDQFFFMADEESGRRGFKQLAEAVHTLHEHGVVHCDIKPDNIMFKDRECMQLKLIDFGSCAYRPDSAVKVHNDFDHTKLPWITAPELVPTSRYTQPFYDVEALGWMLHCIMAGRSIPSIFPSDAWLRIQTTFRPRTEMFSPAAMNLLTRIGPASFGPEEPGQLLKSDEICQHPWLTGVPAIAVQPAELDKHLRAEFAQLQNDLTVLKRLLKEWMILPLKDIASEREFSELYEFQGRIRRSPTEAGVLKVMDLFCSTEMYAIKLIYGRVQGKPEFVLGGHPTRSPLAVYMELLIILRILPRHENIVKLQAVLVNPVYVALVREFLEGSSLDVFFPSAKDANSRTVFKQLAETVRFLHQHGVVHMDLHPQHLVFKDKLFAECTIVNFSRAVFIQQMATSKHENFEANRYLTLELLQPPRDANAQVDITALGRMLHAMMAGQWEPDPAKCADLPPRTDIFGDAACELLSRIGPEPYGPAPNNRTCTIEEICLHPWVVSSR